jgi:NADPH-dependent 2,4-dienoyl-CoA reductase/sulfur reductase-like enzyme
MKIAVIGNSAAAISGIETFRKYDQKSPIVLISREEHLPYSRVLLPYFLLGRIDLDQVSYRSADFYDHMHVEAFLGRSAVDIDIPRKRLYLDDGKRIPFDKLLISSGSSPVKPPIAGLSDLDIGHLWTLEDAARINQLFREKKRLLIVGGGFISLMVAWAALQRKMEVTVVELLPHVMPQILDQKAAELLEAEIRKTGTRLLTGTVIERIEKNPENQYRVYPANRVPFEVDMVIVAAGVRPNREFVDTNQIDTDTGILVNDRMQSSLPGIYAAGDVAQGPAACGGPHCIHALWTTAVEHGKIAGANMAGQDVLYQGSLNNNVSEFFHVTVASIGVLQESAHVRGREYFDSKRRLYLKLFLDGDVPVGGILLGSPEDVSSFGVLRSYILQKKALPDLEILRAPAIREPWHSAFIRGHDSLASNRV